MGSRVSTACSFRSKSIPQQVFHRCRSAEALRLFRVPAVYLTSAFLWFFSILLFRRINNLRRINPLEGFDSHPGHRAFDAAPGAAKFSLATGSFSTWRSLRMSFEFVISCSLIFLTMLSRMVGVRSFLLRFLTSLAHVIDAPGSTRFVSFSKIVDLDQFVQLPHSDAHN